MNYPSFPSVIDCMHQTIKTYLEREHYSILLPVTRTPYVYQVCHGVGRCVKDGSCFSSSLEWKLTDSINGLSHNLNKCQSLSNTSQMTFFSFSNSVHWCTCIKRATQSNCCGALDFLSPERKSRTNIVINAFRSELLGHAPTAPTWTHWLQQDLGSHTAAWLWVASQKDWRKQGATVEFCQCTDTAFERKNASSVFPRFAG